MSPRVDCQGSHGAPKKVVLLTPGIYSPQNYPGFYQKYREIAGSFERRGCVVHIVGYRSNLSALLRLGWHSKLRDADIIWLRCPGVRLWLAALALARYSQNKQLILEHPSPFRHYLKAGGCGRRSLTCLKHWTELVFTFLFFAASRNIFTIVVEYGDESSLLARLFRLNRIGFLLGNPVPRSICKATKLGLVATRAVSCAGTSADKTADVNFLIIANLEPWHGLDRFIRGLGHAFLQTGVAPRLVVVGDVKWDLRQFLDKLIVEHGIAERVDFLGQRTPHEIALLAEGFDVGISALGTHRLGYRVASPLKSGLYTSLGLPFICSCTDVRFGDDFPYRYQCPADESDVDIAAVLRWHSTLDLALTPKRMHEYFLDELSSDKLIAPVFDRLGIPPLSTADEFWTVD